MAAGSVSQSYTPTVTAGAYAQNAVVGGLKTLKIFNSSAQPSGVFDYFMVTSKGGLTTAMTVYVFDQLPSASTFTDNQALVLNSADIAKLAMQPFVVTPAVSGSGTTATTAQLAQITSLQNHDSPITQNLYIALVANGAMTPGSTTDLVIKMGMVCDD